MACRILVPWPGIEPGPWQWKCRVLTTGPPGNFLELSLWFKFMSTVFHNLVGVKHNIRDDIFKKIYLFTWLRWVLVTAGGLLSCGRRTLSCSMHVGPSFLTRDRTPGPLHWERRVLTTAPPGKSQEMTFALSYLQPYQWRPRTFLPKCLTTKLSQLDLNH